MTKFLLKHRDTGRFVAKPGLQRSYTRSLKDAETFETEDAARANKCDNESVVKAEDER